MLSTAASADTIDDCGQGRDPELSITSCTQLIDSGDYADAALGALHNNRGLSLLASRRYDEAIADFDRAIELNTEKIGYLMNRGGAYLDAGQPERAIVDYGKALYLDPMNPPAFDERGLAYKHLGNAEQAMDDFNMAIELDPELGEAWENRGNLQKDLGNPMEAASDWATGMKLRGPERISWWQGGMRQMGYYSGPVDGEINDDFLGALLACARDPKC